MSGIAPSKLTVNLDAYTHNLRVVRQYLPAGTGFIAVVKSNAYGLGAAHIASRAIAEGCAMLAVATVQEGITLRESGVEEPILVLVHPMEEALSEALRHRLRLTIGNVETAERLGEIGRRMKRVAPIHCEIDTGMGRQGFNIEDAPKELLSLTRVSNVDIEAIATHFPLADLANDPFTANQIRELKQLLKQIDKAGIPYDMVHAANSAAVVNYPAAAFDLARPGLMTYGVWPSDAPPDPERSLQPVATWTSRIALVRDLPGGASIGYGRTFKAPRPMRAALVPVGYADGYLPALSNRADVLVRGIRCPIRGTISMDQMVVDVSGVRGVAAGDTVTLLGQDGDESITVEELAAKAECMPYTILTSIGPRVERVYTP